MAKLGTLANNKCKTLWGAYLRDRSRTDLRDSIACEYLGFVRAVAHTVEQHYTNVFEPDELVSIGYCGLLQAIPRYDPKRSATFESFAGRRVLGAIIDAARANDPMSRPWRSQSKKVNQALAEEPTSDVESISRRTGIKEGHVRRVLNLPDLQRAVHTTEWMVPDARSPPASQRDADFRLFVSDLGQQLNRDHRVVFIRVLVLGETQKSVGLDVGLSESRISQIVRHIKRHLRKFLIDDQTRTEGGDVL